MDFNGKTVAIIGVAKSGIAAARLLKRLGANIIMYDAKPKEAFAELQAAGVAVALSDVFALELDNVPGGAADVVRTISEAGISIAYLYSFTHKGKGILIFRTDNMDEAREVITKNNLKYICGKDISELF